VQVKRFLLFPFVVFSLQGEERLLLAGFCDSVGLRINHFWEKFVMIINSILLICWETLSEVIEVRVWHALENEAHDAVRELWAALVVWASILTLHSVDNVHLQIKKMSVNGMLRWGMEMVLHTVKAAFVNMVVEQRNGLGLKPTLLVSLGKIIVVHLEVEGIGFLVELHLFLRVHFLVVESEFIVFELRNFLICVKINRGLIASNLGDKVLVFMLPSWFWNWGFTDITEEVNSWSFNVRMGVVLVVVILVVMEVLMMAVWSAEKWGMGFLVGSTLILDCVFDLSLFAEIVHVR
jgi:hypothetical protein